MALSSSILRTWQDIVLRLIRNDDAPALTVYSMAYFLRMVDSSENPFTSTETFCADSATSSDWSTAVSPVQHNKKCLLTAQRKL
jgi:hypothetical protein